jgi:toluene monooxygenase system ferredoxin subunit
MDGAGAVITYHEACGVDDLWIGDMDAFSIAGKQILLVNAEGVFKAYSNVCPHQDIPLVEGKLNGCVLTCRAHHWEFDVTNGLSINPANQRLVEYPVRINGDIVEIGDMPVNARETERNRPLV